MVEVVGRRIDDQALDYLVVSHLGGDQGLAGEWMEWDESQGERGRTEQEKVSSVRRHGQAAWNSRYGE